MCWLQACLAERWDLMFFTGGSYVGKMVAEAAAKNLTPTILELGGKSPAIVDKRVDIEVSAKRLAWASFTNSGQTCVRPDHLFVHEDVADKFLAALQTACTEMYGDHDLEFHFPMFHYIEGELNLLTHFSIGHDVRHSECFGRLINKRAYQRVAALVAADKDRVAMGGQTDEADLFVAPTVLDFGCDMEAFHKSEAMQDEIFGPVLPMVRYNDIDQVLAAVNAKEKPLALYFFSSDAAAAEKVLSTTTSGGAVVNDCMMHLANPSLPFGGVGNSGMGCYHGKFSFDSFSHKKAVLKKSTFGDVPARYPPYVPWKQTVLGIVEKPYSAAEWGVVKGMGMAGALALAAWARL